MIPEYILPLHRSFLLTFEMFSKNAPDSVHKLIPCLIPPILVNNYKRRLTESKRFNQAPLLCLTQL